MVSWRPEIEEDFGKIDRKMTKTIGKKLRFPC
jgi:hypothetical protein